MSQEQAQLSGPDLTGGIARTEISKGKLLGHVGDQAVLLVQSGDELFAIDAHCTHYSGPLADGLVTEDSIRCPWHHACFSLRTGEALHAPAIGPLSTWQVEEEGGRIFVREKRPTPKPVAKSQPGDPQNVVIVGGGAAGFAAAEMLRREGFAGAS
jgi:nitrite reductase/ring-hydroxylating ferredoxin subunit